MSAIGQPISRIDGRLKVTGRVHYTADIAVADMVHGSIVSSTMANGRTVSIDLQLEQTGGDWKVSGFNIQPQ